MNQQEKEQALDLSALYKELAEQGTWFEFNVYSEWTRANEPPNYHSDLDRWRVAEKQDKIIDMSCLVGSNVDCEFGVEQHRISKLESITDSGFYSKNEGFWTTCRVRQDHWHSWQGGECPLPEGLEIKVIFRDSSKSEVFTTYLESQWDWKHMPNKHDIISFKVLGTAEGWKYE